MIGVIGANGFIGSNFVRKFSSSMTISRECLQSSQILELDQLIIAAPGAKKYEINQNPQPDRENIFELVRQISKKISAIDVILFSTLDVYQNPIKAYENSAIKTDLSYGGNRAVFESEIVLAFPRVRVRRLPGLYGPGLRKNLIFDVVHNRFDQIANYSPDSTFQYMHIDDAIELSVDEKFANHEIMNIVSEPIRVSQITDLGNCESTNIVHYDVRTMYQLDRYFINVEDTLQSLKQFISDESKRRVS